MISQLQKINDFKTLLVLPPEFDIPPFFTANILKLSSKNIVDSVNYNSRLEWEPVEVEANIHFDWIEKIIKFFDASSEIPYTRHNFTIELLNHKNIVLNQWILENAYVKEYSFNRNNPNIERLNFKMSIEYNSFNIVF